MLWKAQIIQKCMPRKPNHAILEVVLSRAVTWGALPACFASWGALSMVVTWSALPSSAAVLLSLAVAAAADGRARLTEAAVLARR